MSNATVVLVINVFQVHSGVQCSLALLSRWRSSELAIRGKIAMPEQKYSLQLSFSSPRSFTPLCRPSCIH